MDTTSERTNRRKTQQRGKKSEHLLSTAKKETTEETSTGQKAKTRRIQTPWKRAQTELETPQDNQTQRRIPGAEKPRTREKELDNTGRLCRD